MKCDVTVEELFQAYYDCRHRKRNTWNALHFEKHLERNLMNLYYQLHDGSYKPGRSMCFVVQHPKIREVWAADFRDRVIHHLIYNRISKRFYNSFVYDSFACIPGKGCLAAAKRVEKHLRRATNNYESRAWALQADVANFFVSVDKQILDKLLTRKIHEPWLLNLTRMVLHHDPTRNVYIRSPGWMIRKVPRHKSLFNSKGRGMPIGNLTSQFFANVYMDPLDQFAKHKLKLRYYARYVDDIVAIGKSGSELYEKYQEMARFAWENLRLKFHPNKTSVLKSSHGINFVGYIIKPYVKYVRKSTVGSFYYRTRTPSRNSDPESLKATVNSYFGLLLHASAWRERCRMGSYLKNEFRVTMDNKMRKMIAQEV